MRELTRQELQAVSGGFVEKLPPPGMTPSIPGFSGEHPEGDIPGQCVRRDQCRDQHAEPPDPIAG